MNTCFSHRVAPVDDDMYRNTGFRATLSYILAIVASMLTFGRELVSLIGGVAVVIKIIGKNFRRYRWVHI